MSNGIKGFTKVCVIENDKIVRMYWEHPEGTDEIPVREILDHWNTTQGPISLTDPEFLRSHGFKPENVIRDGVRPREEKTDETEQNK